MVNTGSRARSVVLDPFKVRKLAESRGIYTLMLFERAFLQHLGSPPGASNTTPRNAWSGKKLDKNRATELAIFLGLQSYEHLLPNTCADIIYPEPLHWDAHYSPPGALLKAEYGIVPFHGRTDELEDLHAWCSSDEALSVRLYTGAGGMGKTRLAIEQCRRLAKHGQWLSGFLRHGHSAYDDEERFAWFENITQSVFLIVDYAETRRHEVADLLQAAIRRGKTRSRIVLLARAAADWWNILKTAGNGVGDLLMSPATMWITLRPLLRNGENREKSFFLAADSFARQLKRPTIANLPEDIGADYFDRVLFLHMQALIAVEGGPIRQGVEGILGVILNRERRFWENQVSARLLPSGFHKAIGVILSRINLMGGVQDQQAAIKVLADIPVLADSRIHERLELVELLHDLYPGQMQNPRKGLGNYIEPLQPDLLGEYLLQEELNKNSASVLEFVFRK